MIVVTVSGHTVVIKRSTPQGVESMMLSWPEVNELQSYLRQACVEAGITMRDAF